MKLKDIFKLFIIAVSIQHSLMLEASNPKFHFYGLLYAARNNGATSEQLSAQLNEIIPLDLRDNMTIALGNSGAWNYLTTKNDYNIGNGDNYLDFCKRLNQQGIKFSFEIADPAFPVWPENFKIPNYDDAGKRIDRFSFSVAQIDSVFKNCSNCVAVKTGEVFWGYDKAKEEWLLSVLRVCKKYNKKAYISEGVWLDSHWMKFFYQNYKELYNDGLGAYLVPEFKNTKPAGAYFTMSTLLGAWLTNEVGEIGMYNDHWVWCYQSFANANEYPAYRKADGNQALCPYIYFLRQWILGAAMGCNAFAMETPNFDRDGKNYPNATRYLFPFMRGLLQHDIVPSKDKVIEKAKAIINPFGNYPNGKIYNPSELFLNYLDSNPGWQRPTWGSTWIDPFGVLYRNSLGFSDESAYQDSIAIRPYYSGIKSNLKDFILRENIPNESKYYFLPLLPHPDATFSSSLTKIDIKNYRTDQEMQNCLDAVFTDASTKGKAWQTEIDNSFFVLNTHENTDIDETFGFNLGSTIIQSMNGIMPFQNVLFGKREGVDNYWFQTNGYVGDGVSAFQTYKSTFKPTTVSFICSKEPVVTVENNKSRFVTKTWNEETKTLTLVCNHLQAGAVNFRIQGDVNSAITSTKFVKPTLNIYPNPSKNNIHLKFETENNGKYSIELYDMTGRLVMNPVTNQSHAIGEIIHSLDISTLDQGQYICKTILNDKSSFKKIITKL